MGRFLIILACGLLGSEPDSASRKVPTASEINATILDARRKIKSGEFRLESTIWEFPGGAKRIAYTDVRTVWLDGKMMREDVVVPLSIDGQLTRRETKCYADGKFLYWNDQMGNNEGGMVVSETARPKPSSSLHETMVDTKLLGITVSESPNLVHYKLDSFIGSGETASEKVVQAVLNDAECYRVEGVTRNGVTVRYWVSPQRNMSVVRIETEFDSDGKHYLSSVDVELVICDSETLWFPSVCNYKRLVDGKPVREEHLKVNTININRTINEQIFSLKGMEIRPNTRVQRFPRDVRGDVVWDGKAVMPIYEPIESRSHDWSRSFLLTNALLCVLIAAGAVTWMIKKRGTT